MLAVANFESQNKDSLVTDKYHWMITKYFRMSSHLSTDEALEKEDRIDKMKTI